MAQNGNGNLNKRSIQSALSGEAAGVLGDEGISVLQPFMLNITQNEDPITPWSEYPHARDKQLVRFGREESIFAGAQYSMGTRLKSLPFTVLGPDRTVNLANRLLDSADGGLGLRSVIEKMMYAYDTQDNGWFVELVGAGSPEKEMIGRPVTFNFLDPAHCYRTFNPKYPVFYRDPLTFKFHKLHKSRVISGASMPSISATARGVGYCTLSRALRLLRIIHGIAVYKDEKVSGRFTRAIGYGKGVTNQQLGSIFASTPELADAMGLTHYNGIPWITSVNGVELGLLDLASVPDGFDTEKDTTLYVYALALAFGTDAREIWPASSSGATKADASVQHMKAQGKGIADRIRSVEWMLMNGPLRGLNVTVEADFTDDEQDFRQAELHRVRADTFKLFLDMKVLNERQVKALAISEGILDGKVLATVDDILVDVDAAEIAMKPDPMEEKRQQEQAAQLELMQASQPPQPGEDDDEEEDADEDATNGTGKFPFAKKKALETKDYAATETQFVASLADLIEAGVDNEVNRRRFGTVFRAQLRKSGDRAYRDGLKAGGVEDDLSDDDRATFNQILNSQSAYITSFANSLYSDGVLVSDYAARAQMWANKSLAAFWTAGMLSADRNALMEFVGDDGKNSCPECKALKGQKHRLWEWEDKGYNPMGDSSKLGCGGFQCHHILVKASGKSKGKWV